MSADTGGSVLTVMVMRSPVAYALLSEVIVRPALVRGIDNLSASSNRLSSV